MTLCKNLSQASTLLGNKQHLQVNKLAAMNCNCFIDTFHYHLVYSNKYISAVIAVKNAEFTEKNDKK